MDVGWQDDNGYDDGVHFNRCAIPKQREEGRQWGGLVSNHNRWEHAPQTMNEKTTIMKLTFCLIEAPSKLLFPFLLTTTTSFFFW